jgi:hypothetical protein
MASQRGGFLRDNAFLVAAVALPVAVAGFFLIATAIPRWTVPPPQYDLVLRVERPYPDATAKVGVDVAVRDGRVEATVRPAPKDVYTRRWALVVFDHTTLKTREVPLDIPTDLKSDESRTFVVEALAGRRVSSDAKAPDGYELSTRGNGGGGLVGDIFGMGRSRRPEAVVNRGRAVPLDLPAQYQEWYGWPVTPVGWVVGEATQPPAVVNPRSH